MPVRIKLFNAAITFLLLVFACSSGAENSWFARPWRTDDGLPDNAISGIAQSPDGFLWVGTSSGLARFDGAQFDAFSPENIPDVSERAVRALMIDHLGRFWIGTDRGGVLCIGDKRTQFFSPKDGLPDLIQKIIVEDGDGAVWICFTSTRAGIARIQNGNVTVFGTASGLPGYGLCWITTDIHGKLWYARNGEIGFFDKSIEHFQSVCSLPENFASITAANDGGLWICTSNRVLKLDVSNHLHELGTLPAPAVGGGPLFQSRDGGLWIATSRAYGLFRFEPANNHFELVPTTHPIINCITEDREGNLWVGTAGGGLERLRPKVLDLMDASLLPFESIHSICEDSMSNLWAVNRDGILTLSPESNPESKIILNNLENWPGGDASCVAAANDGVVWIGTHNDGLYRFESNRFTAFRRGSSALASNGVRSLLVAANGDLWIGSDPSHLQRLRNGKFKSFALPPNSRSIRAMAEDTQENIWVATSEGLLARINGTNIVNETTNFLSQPISIRCLAATPDGCLWIGYSGGGLGRIKDGKYFRITTAQGLDNDYISEIIPDNQGWLWMSGDHGFFRIRLQQLNDVAEGRGEHLRSVTFGRGEGLSGLEANYDNFPTAFCGRDGRLRIAVHTGVVVIDPENIRDNLTPPPVFIERVIVDGQTVARYDSHSQLLSADTNNAIDLKNARAKIHLPPGYHRLEFDFSALSFTAPENVQFRYRLDGFDENWNEAGTMRNAVYARLPAGNYFFNVVACNNSFVWSPVGAALNVTVEPFFWRTWWFQTTALVTFALIVGGLVRYLSFRRLRLKLHALEQQSALDKERARIARDLHDDLGGSLTQVGLVLDMASRNHNGNGNGAEMQKCFTMVRNAANSVDEIIWAINPRNDTAPYLVDYISQFAVEFLHAANIQCRVHLPNTVPTKNVSPEARHNLFLAVKESLNNIARHARASEVHFHVNADDKKISIAIEDNGYGFQLNNANGAGTLNPQLNEDGLRNMRQRMEEIGGQFQIKSGSETGTCVSFIYPWPEK